MVAIVVPLALVTAFVEERWSLWVWEVDVAAGIADTLYATFTVTVSTFSISVVGVLSILRRKLVLESSVSLHVRPQVSVELPVV
jgi:hypothetical protein